MTDSGILFVLVSGEADTEDEEDTRTSTERTRASILRTRWARAGGTEGEGGRVSDHHVEVRLKNHVMLSATHTH